MHLDDMQHVHVCVCAHVSASASAPCAYVCTHAWSVSAWCAHIHAQLCLVYVCTCARMCTHVCLHVCLCPGIRVNVYMCGTCICLSLG